MEYICNLCPRRCNAKRTKDCNIGGICGMPFKITAARAAPHYWEEPCISSTNGSGTVFFTGCQLKCVYCQNREISHNKFGKKLSTSALADVFKQLVLKGVHNINLVSPTQFVPLIIKALNIYRPPVPIVFNSGGYESIDTLEMLKGYVDIFLMDIKYFNVEHANEYSNAADYPEVAKKAVLKAVEMVGKPSFYASGIMKSCVIVRHLLLPSCTNDAIEIMRWIKHKNLPIVFSLMNQYTVMEGVPKKLSRNVTKREYDKVLTALQEIGLDGYAQEKSSSGIKYIPNFDLSGL